MYCGNTVQLKNVKQVCKKYLLFLYQSIVIHVCSLNAVSFLICKIHLCKLFVNLLVWFIHRYTHFHTYYHCCFVSKELPCRLQADVK